MSAYFYLILGIAVSFGTVFVISTKGIYYHAHDTDNELMAYAAAQSGKWRWLSDVHKFSASTRKCSMKEWTIILLSIFQKIFRDKTTDWPYVAMTGLAVSINTLLIYGIASNYFNPMVGLIIATIYIISFWPWQVSLYGGHVNVANLFFLLSVYSIQASTSTVIPNLVLLATGGAFLGFCLFSSPSSHKYFIAVFAALFFNEYRKLFASYNIGAVIHALPVNHLLLMDGIIIAAFVSIYILILSTHKSIIKKIYYREAPNFLNKLMYGKDRFALEHYIDHANKKIGKFTRWIFWGLFSLLLVVNLIPISMFLAFITGLIFVFLIITLPNIKENVVEYFACMLEHKRKTHFRGYVDYFAKRGITVKRNMRGAGLSWVPKLLWTFMPFHIAIFIAVFIFGQYNSISAGNMSESILLIVVAFIALSPIIWAEITKAPQASRLYSPGLIASLLLPAYVLSNTTWTTYTLLIVSGIGILAFAWNLWRFTDDIYPARMTVRHFVQLLHQLNIRDVYTYQISFNNAFVGAVPGIGKYEYLPKRDIVPPFRVHYIQRLDEVANGWIAIPGTSAKTIFTTEEGMIGDYKKDSLLNRLIETKQIEKIATAKFKTYGTSTIWINEDDITSYRALHLKDIGPEDLYRGYAWLVHSSAIKKLAL